AFYRDVLGQPGVDAGGGWLIFALPPAEVAFHPEDGPPRHELFLICDDLDATMAELEARGVSFTAGGSGGRWGRGAGLGVAGAAEVGLYEPRHPRPAPST